jgi:hypothetical protein
MITLSWWHIIILILFWHLTQPIGNLIIKKITNKNSVKWRLKKLRCYKEIIKPLLKNGNIPIIITYEEYRSSYLPFFAYFKFYFEEPIYFCNHQDFQSFLKTGGEEDNWKTDAVLLQLKENIYNQYYNKPQD